MDVLGNRIEANPLARKLLCYLRPQGSATRCFEALGDRFGEPVLKHGKSKGIASVPFQNVPSEESQATETLP